MIFPGPDSLISLITAIHLLVLRVAVSKTQQVSAFEPTLDSLVSGYRRGGQSRWRKSYDLWKMIVITDVQTQ